MIVRRKSSAARYPLAAVEAPTNLSNVKLPPPAAAVDLWGEGPPTPTSRRSRQAADIYEIDVSLSPALTPSQRAASMRA